MNAADERLLAASRLNAEAGWSAANDAAGQLAEVEARAFTAGFLAAANEAVRQAEACRAGATTDFDRHNASGMEDIAAVLVLIAGDPEKIAARRRAP